MKAGDIVGVSSNIWIQGATLDLFSHVAIAANDSEVLEILTSGLKRRSLDDCIKDAKSAVLFERPTELTNEQAQTLLREFNSLKLNKVKYGYLRMLYSGWLPAIRNIVYFVALASLLLIYFFESPQFLLVSFTLFLYPVATFLMQRLVSNKKWLRSLGFPEFIIKDLPGQFCSKLVCELDFVSGGNIFRELKQYHEARPSDVVRSCKCLGYAEKKLK